MRIPPALVPYTTGHTIIYNGSGRHLLDGRMKRVQHKDMSPHAIQYRKDYARAYNKLNSRAIALAKKARFNALSPEDQERIRERRRASCRAWKARNHDAANARANERRRGNPRAQELSRKASLKSYYKNRKIILARRKRERARVGSKLNTYYSRTRDARRAYSTAWRHKKLGPPDYRAVDKRKRDDKGRLLPGKVVRP